MNQTVNLNGTAITYILIQRQGTRTVRLSVKPGGQVRVSAPVKYSLQQIDQFMQRKAKWILSKHLELSKYPVKDRAISRVEYLQHKQSALVLAQTKINYYSQIYQLAPRKVTIKNHQSLWGSCSRRGNINFNYRIIFLPEHLCNYIIVHELCHLIEFNHSKSFWDLVSKTIPDAPQCRAELKKWGLSLG